MSKRRRTEIKYIESAAAKNVSFSKRKKGLYKKSDELCRLYSNISVASIIFSPAGRPFVYGNPSSLLGRPSNYSVNEINDLLAVDVTSFSKAELEHYKDQLLHLKSYVISSNNNDQEIVEKNYNNDQEEENGNNDQEGVTSFSKAELEHYKDQLLHLKSYVISSNNNDQEIVEKNYNNDQEEENGNNDQEGVSSFSKAELELYKDQVLHLNSYVMASNSNDQEIVQKNNNDQEEENPSIIVSKTPNLDIEDSFFDGLESYFSSEFGLESFGNGNLDFGIDLSDMGVEFGMDNENFDFGSNLFGEDCCLTSSSRDETDCKSERNGFVDDEIQALVGQFFEDDNANSIENIF